MNADDSIPVDYIRTTFKMNRFRICSLDFIHQNTNRIRQSYRVDWPSLVDGFVVIAAGGDKVQISGYSKIDSD